MNSFQTANLSFIIALASLLSFGQAVTNRALMVDQDGNVNIPEVLATTAQLTSNEVALVAAKAAAKEAENVAREGTNLVQGTIDSIVNNEFVVYRYGYTDSLGVMVVLPPNTLCAVSKFDASPLQVTGSQKQLSLRYATTENADLVEPLLKYSDDLSKDFDFLDSAITKTKTGNSFTNLMTGVVYPYEYEIKFWVDMNNKGFFIVYLDGDAQDGDGMTFNIVGGITGGETSVITNGTQTLHFIGGLLMEVKAQ